MNSTNFKKLLISQLETIGYEKFKGNSELRFVKPVGNNFYNILLITFNRYDKTAFTGDFFLSLYPSNFYEEYGKRKIYRNRIAPYLSLIERKNLLNNDKNRVDRSGGDAWWYSDDEYVIENFVQTVDIVTPRFLAQEHIYQQVLDNERLRWYYNKDVLKIIELAYSNQLDYEEYTLIPKSDSDKIGMNWFKAAELYIKHHTKRYELKMSWVKELASEAYMTNKYENLYGSYNPILLDLKQKNFDEF